SVFHHNASGGGYLDFRRCGQEDLRVGFAVLDFFRRNDGVEKRSETEGREDHVEICRRRRRGNRLTPFAGFQMFEPPAHSGQRLNSSPAYQFTILLFFVVTDPGNELSVDLRAEIGAQDLVIAAPESREKLLSSEFMLFSGERRAPADVMILQRIYEGAVDVP